MNLNPGQNDIRLLKAMANYPGQTGNQEAYCRAQRWDPSIADRIHAAAVGGQSVVGDGSLVGVTGVSILELVRPNTLIGRLPLQRVPFGVRCISETVGVSAAFAGEGKSVPAGRPTYSTVLSSLPILKVTTIAVVTSELVKSSALNAESTLSKAFTGACIERADRLFLDPSNSGVANATPASITNAAPSFSGTGVTVAAVDADLGKLVDSLTARGSTLVNAWWILDPFACSFLCRLRGTGGVAIYPNLNMKGGEIWGLPALITASQFNVGSPQSSSITLVDCDRVWLADDGVMQLDASKVASIQQSDVPTVDAVLPTPTTLTSMYQTDSIALKGVRNMNWKADSTAVAQLNGVGF
jgi:hypothetical protein